MNGVVEAPGKLRNMSYLGLAFKRVLLVEPSSHSPRHIVVVSKRPNGTWLIMLVDKRPEPALSVDGYEVRLPMVASNEKPDSKLGAFLKFEGQRT